MVSLPPSLPPHKLHKNIFLTQMSNWDVVARHITFEVFCSCFTQLNNRSEQGKTERPMGSKSHFLWSDDVSFVIYFSFINTRHMRYLLCLASVIMSYRATLSQADGKESTIITSLLQFDNLKSFSVYWIILYTKSTSHTAKICIYVQKYRIRHRTRRLITYIYIDTDDHVTPLTQSN